jgi:fumarate reductase subunit C
MPRAWWTRRANYFWYIVREFTSLPLALWLIWLLIEIRRAHHGPGVYYASHSPLFIAFSVIVLLFALYHTVTFLSLAGAILHFNVADRPIPSQLIVLSQFAAWLAASVVVGFVLIYFGRT